MKTNFIAYCNRDCNIFFFFCYLHIVSTNSLGVIYKHKKFFYFCSQFVNYFIYNNKKENIKMFVRSSKIFTKNVVKTFVLKLKRNYFVYIYVYWKQNYFYKYLLLYGWTKLFRIDLNSIWLKNWFLYHFNITFWYNISMKINKIAISSYLTNCFIFSI